MTTTAHVPGKSKQEMKTSNYITLFIVATVLVLLVAGYFTKSLTLKLLLDRKIVDKKTVASDTLKKDVDAAQKLTAAYAALGTQAKLVNDALPANTDFPTLANTLNAMAGASGVKYVTATSNNAAASSDTSASGDPTTTSASSEFTLTVTGNYATISRFLTTIEGSARPMHVNSISLSGTNAALDANLDITTYNQTPASFTITKEAVK